MRINSSAMAVNKDHQSKHLIPPIVCDFSRLIKELLRLDGKPVDNTGTIARDFEARFEKDVLRCFPIQEFSALLERLVHNFKGLIVTGFEDSYLVWFITRHLSCDRLMLSPISHSSLEEGFSMQIVCTNISTPCR